MSSSSSSPIPLAFCITELEPGGAERTLVQLVTHLDRARFSPRVYCLAGRPGCDGYATDSVVGDPSDLADRLDDAAVPLECLGAVGSANAAATIARLTWRLKAARPRLLQTFLFHANLAGRIAGRLAGVPHVVSGIRVAERRGRGRLRWDRWTSWLVERHVCVSRDVAEFSIREGGLPARRCVVIPNGVDLTCFDRPAPVDLPQWPGGDGPVILYVGRLDSQKRIVWLIERAAEFLPRIEGARLAIVGEGPQCGDAAACAARLGIAAQCDFLGRQPHEAVVGMLHRAALLVLPSAWEGMPNVVLEAMASRLPVVSTKVEGVAELLGDQTPAQTVAADDPGGFSRRVVELACDPGARQRLGQLNRLRAEAEFSLSTMVARYEALYDELLRGGRD